MSEQMGGVRPAPNRPAASSSTVSHRRRVSRALDRVCRVAPPEPREVDYDAMGLTLGWAERRAAGLQILSQGAAA
jgi:hypothetical protein